MIKLHYIKETLEVVVIGGTIRSIYVSKTRSWGRTGCRQNQSAPPEPTGPASSFNIRFHCVSRTGGLLPDVSIFMSVISKEEILKARQGRLEDMPLNICG